MLPFVALFALGCSSPASSVSAASAASHIDPLQPPIAKTDPAEAKRVLLVINDASPASVEIGNMYKLQRQIPSENVVRLNTQDRPDIQVKYYEPQILEPIKAKLKASKNPIDFIVLTKGIPFVLHPGSYSVDGHIGGMNLSWDAISSPTEQQVTRALNPYFNKKERFSSKKHGFYLVTRIDGYSVEDCKRLILNSVKAKPHKGPFLMDGDPTRTTNGYRIMQESLVKAGNDLKGKGYDVILDETSKFVNPGKPVAGYSSWGSNDRAFDASAYKGLRFLPGALAETFVSTSARSFKPEATGQSQIGDLIAGGVTGVKGYVSEPYSFALAKPDIIFDRYTSGYNLAESFAMASLVLKWKDVVIGDPLCCPYGKK